MHKTIGGATLNWQELSEVILVIEIQINRCPQCYMEDDVELSTLTPSTFLFQRSSQLPEQEPWREEEKSLRKRAKFLIACNKNLWNPWRREYLTSLGEKHNMTHVSVGDVVIVKSDDKNRRNWPLAIVQRIFPGKDGVVWAVELKTNKGTPKRPVQHLYPMELAKESTKPEPTPLNPKADSFRPKKKQLSKPMTAFRRLKSAKEEYNLRTLEQF